MIFVFVREEDGVEVADARTEHLAAEIGAGVDDHTHAACLDHGRSAQAVVALVGRGANLAAAPDDRDALRGARSQKGEFHAGKDSKNRTTAYGHTEESAAVHRLGRCKVRGCRQGKHPQAAGCLQNRRRQPGKAPGTFRQVPERPGTPARRTRKHRETRPLTPEPGKIPAHRSSGKLSRSARYSRRRHASPASWWRRPSPGKPPSAARPFRRRRWP